MVNKSGETTSLEALDKRLEKRHQDSIKRVVKPSTVDKEYEADRKAQADRENYRP
jgi:hypothetical protein